MDTQQQASSTTLIPGLLDEQQQASSATLIPGLLDEQQQASSVTLIPGLLDELSLLSLACLPARLHPKASFVSRAWQHAFQSQALHALRLQRGSLETWVLLFFSLPTAESISCWVIDSLGIRSYPLHSGDPNRTYWMQAIGTTARGEVLLSGFLADHPPCRYDVLHRRWLHPSAPQMITNSVGTACAVLDGYVYAAGGHTIGASSITVKSGERLDCKNMSLWERLPDMHMVRSGAAGLALHGCFYVIGGYGDGEPDVVHSAEIWDPRCQEWTLVPGFWPSHIFEDSSAIGVVTTLQGRLFAIRHWPHQVMMYDHATKLWTCLGDIPENMLHSPREYLSYEFKLMGVGHELWVVALPESSLLEEEEVEDVDICILACIPCSGGSLIWRRLPYSFDRTLEYHFSFPIIV